jgi:hypothetical protein
MPEAAIDEDGELFGPKDEVRADFATAANRRERNDDLPAPAGDAMCAKKGRETLLGILVSMRADEAHHLAALGFAEDIRHAPPLARRALAAKEIQEVRRTSPESGGKPSKALTKLSFLW